MQSSLEHTLSKGFFSLLKKQLFINDGSNGPAKYCSRLTTWELSMVLNSASHHWTVFPHLVTGLVPCRANPWPELCRCGNENEHGHSLPTVTTLSLSWFPHELHAVWLSSASRLVCLSPDCLISRSHITLPRAISLLPFWRGFQRR